MWAGLWTTTQGCCYRHASHGRYAARCSPLYLQLLSCCFSHFLLPQFLPAASSLLLQLLSAASSCCCIPLLVHPLAAAARLPQPSLLQHPLLQLSAAEALAAPGPVAIGHFLLWLRPQLRGRQLQLLLAGDGRRL